MLEKLIKARHARAWHRGTLFAPYLDGYLREWAAQGFNQHVLIQKLGAVTWFGEYLKRQGVEAIAGITETHVEDFAIEEGEERGHYCVSQRRRAIRDLLRHLERRGAWERPAEPDPSGPVKDYFRSLAEERGLKPISISGYRRLTSVWLKHIGCDGTRESLAGLTAKDIDRFIVHMGSRYSRQSMGRFCVAIRGLLRYLHRTGILTCDLSVSVPTPRYYALERMPCALPWETVQRIVDAVDTTTRRGRRDFAILWLLVTYGLRSGEVAMLRLKDIDWRHDVIHVRRSKRGRPLKLPLTNDVGEALLAYLRDGRPKARCREVFIRTNAPYTPLTNIGGIVTYYLRRAGIESAQGGAHVIRHSFAVHLLRQGEPLKTISDMLGHTDPRSALHYMKLAVEDLHDVALPTAEVMP